MKTMMVILQYALLGVFTQNLVFAGGVGSNRLLRLAKKPQHLFLSAFLMFLFTLSASLAVPFFMSLMRHGEQLSLFWMFFFILCITILYFMLLGISKLLSKKFTGLFPLISAILPSCAFNCIVISIPFIGKTLEFSPVQFIGYCIGSAIGFLIAVLLVHDAMQRLDNPQMQEGFTGLPALFLYIGILSMAFIGFSGQPFMFL